MSIDITVILLIDLFLIKIYIKKNYLYKIIKYIHDNNSPLS